MSFLRFPLWVVVGLWVLRRRSAATPYVNLIDSGYALVLEMVLDELKLVEKNSWVKKIIVNWTLKEMTACLLLLGK